MKAKKRECVAPWHHDVLFVAVMIGGAILAALLMCWTIGFVADHWYWNPPQTVKYVTREVQRPPEYSGCFPGPQFFFENGVQEIRFIEGVGIFSICKLDKPTKPVAKSEPSKIVIHDLTISGPCVSGGK